MIYTAYQPALAILEVRVHLKPIFTRNLAAEYRRVLEMIAWRSPVATAWIDRKQGVTGLIPLKP